MPSIKQNLDISMAATQADNAVAQGLVQEAGGSAAPQKTSGRIGFRAHNRLPDFRNLGVCLRILLIVNFVVMLAAVLQTTDLAAAINQLVDISAFAQPTLLISILALFTVAPMLLRRSYRTGIICVILLELALVTVLFIVGTSLFDPLTMPSLPRVWFLTAIVTGLVLYYFYLRHKALSPAIAEARLQALQARIRPHFLFNSINAVLSLIRSQPKRAETALEDMADLFRVLMADNRNLVPLANEIALSRQYLALEKLRLDERLQISWQIDSMPPDALIPPLVLQPLLENAVYHGIEPMPTGGEIIINIYTSRKEVHIVLSNPFTAQGGHHSGNKMALTNIRERLALHFDAEAALTSKVSAQRYEVHIVIPYQPHTQT